MDAYGVAMTDDEIGSFLARRGHGVLSFGYDVLHNRCIFQLLFAEDSKKLAYLESSPAVNLVAYEWQTVEEWRSVVVDGDLSAIPDDSPEAVDAAEVFAEFATVVGLSVFDRPVEELDSGWYELEIEEMSGRKSPKME